MTAHNPALQPGFSPAPFYVPTIEPGESPYVFDWIDHHHQAAMVRLMAPSTGEDRKRHCTGAEAVLGWYLDAANRAMPIKSNPRPELKGHHWLWRSYDDLAGILYLERDEVQKGVKVLRDHGLLVMDMARVGQGQGKTPLFRLTEPALRMTYLLANWWWGVRDDLILMAKKEPGTGDTSRRAKAFYRKTLTLAFNPSSDEVYSLPELYRAWVTDKDRAKFEVRFTETMQNSAKLAKVKP